jgi:hypothetical protein
MKMDRIGFGSFFVVLKSWFRADNPIPGRQPPEPKLMFGSSRASGRLFGILDGAYPALSLS